MLKERLLLDSVIQIDRSGDIFIPNIYSAKPAIPTKAPSRRVHPEVPNPIPTRTPRPESVPLTPVTIPANPNKPATVPAAPVPVTR